MRQGIGSALDQIMACRLFGTNYLNQCWVIVNWTIKDKLQWNFNRNTKLFIHENASENIVCEMAAILSMGRWCKPLHPGSLSRLRLYLWMVLHKISYSRRRRFLRIWNWSTISVCGRAFSLLAIWCLKTSNVRILHSAETTCLLSLRTLACACV